MIVEVLPLHETAADHTALVSVLNRIHGTSPMTLLDKSNRQYTPLARALAALSCAENPKHETALKAIQNSAAVQRHFHFSFLAISQPGLFESVLLMNTGLAISLMHKDYDRPVFVMSGSLADWRDAVWTGCSEERDPDIRLLFNKVNIWFEKLGLGEVWAQYRRLGLKDGTFKLC